MKFDTIRIAEAADATVIASLANQAFRPMAGAAGWTHEAHLVAGDRINPAQIVQALTEGAIVLLGVFGATVVACVQLEREDSKGKIGLLAVAPGWQNRGCGKEMLARAEDQARQIWQVERFVMSVLTARGELLDYYLRRGYRRTGRSIDYPVGADVGTPLQAELKLEILEKPACREN